LIATPAKPKEDKTNKEGCLKKERKKDTGEVIALKA
jgi:hypothetical protein